MTMTATAIDPKLTECDHDAIPNEQIIDVVLSDDRIRRRVKRGMKTLDAFMPDWHERVNLNELAMHSCIQCILGQLFGSYHHAPDMELFKLTTWSSLMRGERCIANGFDVEIGIPRLFRLVYEVGGAERSRTLIEEEYAKLGRIWTEEILARVNHANEH